MVNQNPLEHNPFTALFGSVEKAEDFRKTFQPVPGDNDVNLPNDENPSLLEKLLLVSTRKPIRNFTYIYLEDAPHISEDSVDAILFERLLLQNIEECIENPKRNPKLNEEKVDVVGRKDIVRYLYEVYERCFKYENHKNKDVAVNVVKKSIISSLLLTIEQPDIFQGQNPKKQLTELVFECLPHCTSFRNLINQLIETSSHENQPHIQEFFVGVINEIKQRIDNFSLMGIDFEIVDIIEFYACSSVLAPLLLPFPSKEEYLGFEFEKTVLGSLLSLSCLPKSMGQKCEFFTEPSKQGSQAIKSMEHSIGVAQKYLNTRIHKIFLLLLKVNSEVKHKLLLWIENCLKANSGRAGLWHIQGNELPSLQFVSDGFMANLGAVMLQLSLPFSRDVTIPNSQSYKILKVDPLYCSYSSKGQHYLGDLPKQSTLLPCSKDEESTNVGEENPSFISSCFFLTHRALHLGIQVMHQKLFKMSQELGRLHHEFQDISNQNSPVAETLRNHIEMKTSVFLSYKAASFEPSFIDNVLQFYASTSLWLVQIALSTPGQPLSFTFKEPSISDLTAERSNNSESVLRYIPEFIVENITEMIIALKRYMPEALSLSVEPMLKFFVSFIITYMGSPEWMNNPHLRAHLAQCLESFISNENETGGLISQSRERLLVEHPLANYLVTAIIHVFVSIEMTGQSVSFEEKFNYRRPMYDIIKEIWETPLHKKQFVLLANFALENMESANPPLFLRFINLLINDGIFLLDEGLSYMSQIREMQSQRVEGASSLLGERERNLQQMGFLARFHNMLGSKTIQTLVRLTEGIPSIFTHPTLVERMASMLNYFLVHLVGPKQRNLKVKDMEKYEFRPAEIVTDICTIYIHLSKSSSFCVAVSADGRSYSSELFEQACIVLNRIGRYALKEQIQEFGSVVNEAQRRYTEDEDLISSAPDDYIDPITLQLMNDPVLLPSSKIIVDRQTIARHLLSDQTDPFNRQPLTMEDILPQHELKDRVQRWKEEKKLSKNI